MAEKFGIKETKEFLHFLFGVAQASIDTAADGKYDIARLIAPLTSFPAAIAGISEIPKELSDLSEEEKAELYHMMEKELHIPNALADMILKKVWKILLELGDFIKLVQK